MIISDTHTHLYLKEFDSDRDQVINKAITSNVSRLFLPAIDSSHTQSMLILKKNFPISEIKKTNYLKYGPYNVSHVVNDLEHMDSPRPWLLPRSPSQGGSERSRGRLLKNFLFKK